MAIESNGTCYLTAAEAASKLETTVTRILMLLRQGALQGMEQDGTWFVDSDSVACAKTHGSDQKAAKGCTSYCAGGCGCH